MPMTPFIGVRISWLILARKRLLARLAASAPSRALIQILPVAFPVGDLLRYSGDSNQFPGPVANGRSPASDPSFQPVGCSYAVFRFDRLALELLPRRIHGVARLALAGRPLPELCGGSDCFLGRGSGAGACVCGGRRAKKNRAVNRATKSPRKHKSQTWGSTLSSPCLKS